MAGALLSTKRRSVSRAALPDSRDVCVAFDLECPVVIKDMPLGDGLCKFIMFQLSPAEASNLAHSILATIGESPVLPGRTDTAPH